MLVLAHGWRLEAGRDSEVLVGEFIGPAVAAIPSCIAERLGACRLALPDRLGEPSAASRWTRTATGVEIEVAVAGVDPHDAALELLVCTGQVLWEVLRPAERRGYLEILHAETRAGVEGEVDQEPLRQKRRLKLSPASARNVYRLERYARASFAYTVAEYIHSLWHDVTVRSGPDHLPAAWLRRRLEALQRWFPPHPGYSLFPPESPPPV